MRRSSTSHGFLLHASNRHLVRSSQSAWLRLQRREPVATSLSAKRHSVTIAVRSGGGAIVSRTCFAPLQASPNAYLPCSHLTHHYLRLRWFWSELPTTSCDKKLELVVGGGRWVRPKRAQLQCHHWHGNGRGELGVVVGGRIGGCRLFSQTKRSAGATGIPHRQNASPSSDRLETAPDGVCPKQLPWHCCA